MALIKLLDTHTINKIAAGEVVERPSSVVKELVENSIDANASSITVEIKNGGIDLIRVTDNGKGIPKDEVEMAFLRHATSKINQAEDLEHVLSLGFRGEALASIASVAKVELLTKTKGSITGKRIEVEAGKIKASEEIACPEGTTFIMRQLFYNVPARRAFLKAATTEGSKISDIMYKLALGHPEVAFKFIQNNKLVFQTNGGHDLTRTTFNLYGREVAENTIPIHYVKGPIEVTGLIGLPTLTRGNRNYEQFFINGRYIKSYLLQKATEEAYKTLVTVGKFPFVILHLHLAAEEVDVNVHPTKLEVRFRTSDPIYQAIYEAITHHLSGKNLIPEVKHLTQKPSKSISEPVTTQIKVESFFEKPKPYEPYTPSKMVSVPTKSAEDFKTKQAYQPLFEKATTPSELINTQPEHLTQNFSCLEVGSTEFEHPSLIHDEVIESSKFYVKEEEEKSSILESLPIPEIQPYKPVEGLDYKIVGQLFNTYWIIEHNHEVLLMDQHAAHERVMYETYLSDFMHSTVQSQLLLVPETLKLPASELTLVEENLELFKKLGFEIELFGNDSLLVREVPYLFNKPMGITSFREVLDRLEYESIDTVYKLKEEHIIQLSCKSAVKARDSLSHMECKALIESLLTLQNPYTCPHGRPTLVKLTQTDIEKIFKRIQ